MNDSPRELLKNGYPLISTDAAFAEAFRIADIVTEHAPLSFDLSYMDGITGISVFICAAASFQEDRKQKQRLADWLGSFTGSLDDHLSGIDGVRDLSLSSGLFGIIYSLLMMYQITKDTGYRDLLNKYASLPVNASVPTPNFPDTYLGLSGCIAVICDILEYSDSQKILIPTLQDDLTRLLASYMDRLMQLRQKESDGLWDTLDYGRKISGYGHGIFGIAYALMLGCRVLDKADGIIPEKKIDLYRQAVTDALSFELNIYDDKLCEWPDLRPFASLPALHGTCSGAPGIGIGSLRLSLSEPSANIKTLCDMAHNSCMFLPMNVNDHLCCGKASLVEYFNIHSELGHTDNACARAILSMMLDTRIKTGSIYYKTSDKISPDDLSLFFGISGIGYEFLRSASEFCLPSPIP